MNRILSKNVLSIIITMVLNVLTCSFSNAINIPHQISYQGKLIESSIPVNGNKTFTFSFLTSDWSETHHLQVKNGLYAVIQNSLEKISLLQGVNYQWRTEQ